MKTTRFFIIWLLILFQNQCGAQRYIEESLSDQISIKVTLHEYKIDTCIEELLCSIVYVDSNRLQYPSKFYYYMLQFEETTAYRRMSIIPKRWTRYLPRDCSGLIQVDDMSFVCCGNFKNSHLFTDMRVDLSKEVYINTLYDTLNEKKERSLLDWENSPTALIGSFKLCQGSPIDLYINVGSKIHGVEIKK